MNQDKLFSTLRRKYTAKTLNSTHHRVVQISHIIDRPSKQIVWLGTSPIKWGIQSQIICS